MRTALATPEGSRTWTTVRAQEPPPGGRRVSGDGAAACSPPARAPPHRRHDGEETSCSERGLPRVFLTLRRSSRAQLPRSSEVPVPAVHQEVPLSTLGPASEGLRRDRSGL